MKTVEARIVKLVKKWSKRLDLLEWDFRLAFDYTKNSRDAGAYANVWWDPDWCLARITFFSPNKWERKIFEHTVLHELCHVRISGWDQVKDGPEPGMERAINRLVTLILSGGRARGNRGIRVKRQR